MPEAARFSYPFATLQQLAEDVLKHARDKGATASVCAASSTTFMHWGSTTCGF